MPRPAGHAVQAERLLSEAAECIDAGFVDAAAALATAAQAHATLHLAAVTRAKIVPPDAQLAGESITVRPAEAARRLGVSRSTIYKLIADGDLPAVKLGGATVLAVEDLKASAAGGRS